MKAESGYSTFKSDRQIPVIQLGWHLLEEQAVRCPHQCAQDWIVDFATE
jgi:hypothetical protein